MSSVPVPPPNVEAWLMAPCASTVPVLMAPAVSVSVPVATRLSPAATVFVPALKRRSLNVSDDATSTVAAPVIKATVPPFALNVPPAVWVRLPAIDSTPVVAVNVPPLIVNGPLTVIAAAPPAKLAPAWLNPVAPIVTAADWVIAPP